MALSFKDHAVRSAPLSTQHASVRESPSRALLMKWTKTATSYHRSLSFQSHYNAASLCSYQNKALVAQQGCVCVCVCCELRDERQGISPLGISAKLQRETCLKQPSCYRQMKKGRCVISANLLSLSRSITFSFFFSLFASLPHRNAWLSSGTEIKQLAGGK